MARDETRNGKTGILEPFVISINILAISFNRHCRRENNGENMKKASTILLCAVLALGLSGCSSNLATQDTASEDAASQSAAAASSSAAASKSAEAKKKADEDAAKLADAKTTLTSKVQEAQALLDSSSNSVADPQTRAALTDAINTANDIDSDNPQNYTDALTPLQQNMDTVNASVEQKKQDDAAAAAKQAEADAAAKRAEEQKASEDAAAAQNARNQQQSTYYANCAAVRAAGKAPIYRGEPGYSAKLDRDGDGIGCE